MYFSRILSSFFYLPFQFATAQSPSEAELNAPTISNSSSLTVTPKTTASVGAADARNDGAPVGGGRGGAAAAASSSVFRGAIQ